MLSNLGTCPLFRDHLVNLDKEGIEKFEAMSKCCNIATSVHSLTICPIRLFPLNDQSGGHDGINLTENGWESFTSIHFGLYKHGAKSSQSKEPPYDDSPKPSLVNPNIRLSTALSKLTECKKLSIKDLDGPRISDDRYLNGVTNVTDFARGYIMSALRAAILSTIKIEYLNIRIGDRQVHPRFISLDMLSGLGQEYKHLRRLHISIDSKFSNPVQLQEFVQGFPNLSEFSLQVSSTVFHIKSSGALEKLFVPGLKRLSLDAVECPAGELEDFLLRHKRTLREVNLNRITSIPDTQWLSISHKTRPHLRLSHFSIVPRPDHGYPIY
jgi:hypothetical protein